MRSSRSDPPRLNGRQSWNSQVEPPHIGHCSGAIFALAP